MQHKNKSKFLYYLEIQLKSYRHVYALSVRQRNEAGNTKVSDELHNILNERNSAIEEVQRIENLISHLNKSEKQKEREILDIQDELRHTIEKIISTDIETGNLIKKRKAAITTELAGLRRGKSFSKKYGHDGDMPNLLSIRK